MINNKIKKNKQNKTYKTNKTFLARLHFSAEELLLYPRRRRPQNVRANVKVFEF